MNKRPDLVLVHSHMQNSASGAGRTLALAAITLVGKLKRQPTPVSSNFLAHDREPKNLNHHTILQPSL
jgi:hypothetical protein